MVNTRPNLDAKERNSYEMSFPLTQRPKSKEDLKIHFKTEFSENNFIQKEKSFRMPGEVEKYVILNEKSKISRPKSQNVDFQNKNSIKKYERYTKFHEDIRRNDYLNERRRAAHRSMKTKKFNWTKIKYSTDRQENLGLESERDKRRIENIDKVVKEGFRATLSRPKTVS